jgi:diphthamide synthase subunit DPH2
MQSASCPNRPVPLDELKRWGTPIHTLRRPRDLVVQLGCPRRLSTSNEECWDHAGHGIPDALG